MIESGRSLRICGENLSYVVKLSDDDVENIRLELQAYCSPNINYFFFEYVGPMKFDVCTEDELLAHITSVSVHKDVHRMVLNSLLQDKGD